MKIYNNMIHYIFYRQISIFKYIMNEIKHLKITLNYTKKNNAN